LIRQKRSIGKEKILDQRKISEKNTSPLCAAETKEITVNYLNFLEREWSVMERKYWRPPNRSNSEFSRLWGNKKVEAVASPTQPQILSQKFPPREIFPSIPEVT
jgi:hypothetical protein